MASGDTTSRRPVAVVEAPAHPVQQLQGPFEESMLESQSEHPDEIDVPLDATSRRTILLEAPTYQRVVAGRWKQKRGEKYHPLWKLVAQMSFGIHLLAENMARSEEDVFQILQTHVDDIDVFLERTTEDFVLAQEDIHERLKCLQLPLQHPEVFDRMLEDRTFRNSIVDGNEKIEHIVIRTGSAMKDALKDVQKGFDSSSALERYLHDLQLGWVRTTPEHDAVFVAMLGNVEGWKRAFQDLHMQGNKLAGSLGKLTDVINQMQQRAGEVSRRLIRQQQTPGGSINGTNAITYISHQQSKSRSSSRQQATPSPLAAKKPLPAPTSRGSTRQHSQSYSGENAQAQRTGTSHSQRSGTSQSVMSNSRTETPVSRTHSRNDMMSMSMRDNNQNATSTNTPRMVYVTGHSNERTSDSQVTPIQQYSTNILSNRAELDVARASQGERRPPDMPKLQIRRQGSNISTISKEQPAMLISRNFVPVELPAEMPPTAFLQAFMSKTNRLSVGLGILPSDRRAQTQSKGFNPTTALIELLSDPSRYSRLPHTPNSAYSPGSTLASLEGRQHLTSQSSQQSVLRGSTPDQTPSELPTGTEHEIPLLSRQRSTEAIKPASVLNNDAAKRKKLSFIAELEGSEPVLLPSTIYMPKSANVAMPMTFELEAPHMYFNLPPRPVNATQGSASEPEIRGSDSKQSSVEAEIPVTVVKAANASNLKLGEAIRTTVPVGRTHNTKPLLEERGQATGTEVASSVIAAPTSEHSTSTLPIKSNVTTKERIDSKNSPTFKTSISPTSIDLARSNTEDSRKKWKAFFGQRKSPGMGTDKSPTPPPHLHSAPSKQSAQSSPRSAAFGNLSLRLKASRDNLTSGVKLNKNDDGRSLRNTSPLVKSEHSEDPDTEGDR